MRIRTLVTENVPQSARGRFLLLLIEAVFTTRDKTERTIPCLSHTLLITPSPPRSRSIWPPHHRVLRCIKPAVVCEEGVLANICPFYYHQGVAFTVSLMYGTHLFSISFGSSRGSFRE